MGSKTASNCAVSSNRFSTTPAPSAVTIDVLVVAGGGAGGAGTQSGYYGGGGGAGGMADLTGMKVAKGVQYTVTVGTGGTGSSTFTGTAGTDSLFGLPSGTENLDFGIRTKGGAPGCGSGDSNVYYGGCGGGGGYGGPAGRAILANQGNNGGAGGNNGPSGGGGAGAVGYSFTTNSGVGNGGIGKQSSITGTAVYYAGGGGAGSANATTVAGGNGGGGTGTGSSSNSPTSGTNGLGAGGGGSVYGTTSGNGGSGVVIVRTTNSVPLATTTGSPTITYPAGYIVYKFTSSGTISF